MVKLQAPASGFAHWTRLGIEVWYGGVAAFENTSSIERFYGFM
jgi:hypothetical protein